MKKKEHSDTLVFPLGFPTLVHVNIATGPTTVISPSTRMNQSREMGGYDSRKGSVGRVSEFISWESGMLLSLIIPQRPKLASTRDTVSSLGLIKRDVHVTESASVINACHFRHALALDERRVKFMPEYFLEMNAHHSAGSPRSAVSDVKEVWFAGSHSDV